MEDVLRMAHRSSLAGLFAAAVVTGCSPASSTTTTSLTEAEVSAFMRDYAADLQARNSEAVIARYDAAGVYMLGAGNKMFLPKDSIAAVYRNGWKGPEFFEWVNLSYEMVGPSAAVVAGQFRWVDIGGKDTLRFSYTSLVRNTPTGLRIRLEDESPAPPETR